MSNPLLEYDKRIKQYESNLKKDNSMIGAISTSRLVVFLSGLGIGIYLYVNREYFPAAAAAASFLFLFILLVILHSRYLEKRKYSAALLELNINSVRRLQGKWRDFPDTGEDFTDENHNFSGDLDIFGRGSVFQWINNTTTFHGRRKLREYLVTRPVSRDEILKRQGAVCELADKLDWRQRMAAEGRVTSAVSVDPSDLLSWAEDRNDFYCSFMAAIFFRILPAITIISIVLYFTSNMIPVVIPGIMILVQTFLIISGSGRRNRILRVVYKYLDSIKAFAGILKIIEDEEFGSSYMMEIKKRLHGSGGQKAYFQIKKLDRINSAIGNRNYMFYIVFNILFLLDYQLMITLEYWKRSSGIHIKDWLDVIGEVEAFSSLAVIRYDNPDWSLPEISEGNPLFRAEQMGHPLIGCKCVRNSVGFMKPHKVFLITGSNMSGKSTLLRTAGVNLVLAYCGSPVFARKFSCSIMDIYTCMRIRDDLDKNISSFYAELLRIKKIVEAVDCHKPVFFLLDEIFKGTNSIDRHTGAKILIKKLINGNALGFVSTHDLELGELEKESQMVRDYHFQEHYSNNEIVFDYKLRPGVSTTRNAMYLMKLAGIETE